MKLRSFPSLPSITSSQSRFKEASFILNFRQRSSFCPENYASLLPSGCCHSSTRPPPPPLPDPPVGDDSSGSFSGLQETFSKAQDKVRIFFAVLLWMLLFFWASAWDGRDDSGNKKKSPFGKKFK